MTKKYFEQPALVVVHLKKNDVIATSTTTVNVFGTYSEGNMEDLAPERRGWDAGY